jgi:hypothetical protein
MAQTTGEKLIKILEVFSLQSTKNPLQLSLQIAIYLTPEILHFIAFKWDTFNPQEKGT